MGGLLRGAALAVDRGGRDGLGEPGAEDGVAAGFACTIIADATRAIDTAGSLAAAWARMNAAGVTRATAAEFL